MRADIKIRLLQLSTVVGDYTNTMKRIFSLNFDSYQALKQHGYTNEWKTREAVNQKSFSFCTCKPIRKKLSLQ